MVPVLWAVVARASGMMVSVWAECCGAPFETNNLGRVLYLILNNHEFKNGHDIEIPTKAMQPHIVFHT